MTLLYQSDKGMLKALVGIRIYCQVARHNCITRNLSGGTIMALDKAKTDELKDAIATGRKRSLPFGLCLGKKPEGTVLITHKTKSPKVLCGNG
ncbi:MAG: hypothetical protein ACI9H6_000644 [Patiriisocius sp.]|jgi:hypothetical protein